VLSTSWHLYIVWYRQYHSLTTSMIMQNHVRCRTHFLRKHILFLWAWLISGFINTFLFCIRSIPMAQFFNLGQVSVGFNRRSSDLLSITISMLNDFNHWTSIVVYVCKISDPFMFIKFSNLYTFVYLLLKEICLLRHLQHLMFVKLWFFMKMFIISYCLGFLSASVGLTSI
jgi:hypothetical protein